MCILLNFKLQMSNLFLSVITISYLNIRIFYNDNNNLKTVQNQADDFRIIKNRTSLNN